MQRILIYSHRKKKLDGIVNIGHMNTVVQLERKEAEDVVAESSSWMMDCCVPRPAQSSTRAFSDKYEAMRLLYDDAKIKNDAL